MINIVEIKNRVNNGCTTPYVVWCDDKNSYVVKFPGNIQGKKALVNEFIASRLCEYLELPIMNYNLINVKKSDYNDNMKDDIKFISGTAFGTIYNDRLLPILNPGMVSKAKNSYDAIKILIFDLLIGNYDRNEGNLMINSYSKELIMLDHTHIFELGTIWDATQLPRLITNKFDTNILNKYNYINIVESLKFNETFYSELHKFINKVKNIKKEYVDKIMSDIPEDWDVNSEEKRLLTDYILIRFNRVDEILELLKLKGGDNSEK